jgi:hypothetical protein
MELRTERAAVPWRWGTVINLYTPKVEKEYSLFLSTPGCAHFLLGRWKKPRKPHPAANFVFRLLLYLDVYSTLPLSTSEMTTSNG